MLAPRSAKSLFSKAWHMQGSPSLVVISIPTLANFVFLYALPMRTKILPTFPCSFFMKQAVNLVNLLGETRMQWVKSAQAVNLFSLLGESRMQWVKSAHLLGLDTCNFTVLPVNKTLSTWSKGKVSFKGPLQFSSWLATSLSYLLGD